MGRPVNNYFFSGCKKLVGEKIENFEQVVVHACLKDGEAAVKLPIVKQTGFNKYLVQKDEDFYVVRLVKKDKVTVEGTAYMTVTDVEGDEHDVYKMTRNFVTTFDGEVLPYIYVLEEIDGELHGSFDTDYAHLEVMAVLDDEPEVVSEAPSPEEEVVEEKPTEEVIPEDPNSVEEEVVEETKTEEEVVEETKTEEEVVEETKTEEVEE